MGEQEQNTPAEPMSPRRKLQVARETLRQLGAQTLRNVAGGTQYYTEGTTCDGFACTDACPSAPGCETGTQCMTMTNDAWCGTYAC